MWLFQCAMEEMKIVQLIHQCDQTLISVQSIVREHCEEKKMYIPEGAE